MADPVTADEVLRHLTEARYPTDKEKLTSTAERAGAPEAVLRTIRAFPPLAYRDRDDVLESLRPGEAGQRSA